MYYCELKVYIPHNYYYRILNLLDYLRKDNAGHGHPGGKLQYFSKQYIHLFLIDHSPYYKKIVCPVGKLDAYQK